MKKLLIVDDTKINIKLMETILQKEGYEIITAFDGQSGIDMAISEKPDLIFMDIQMPNVDGITAIKTIKANFDTKRIPIIAITAHLLTEDIQSIMTSGCDDYVFRPIKSKELLKLVAKYLNEGS